MTPQAAAQVEADCIKILADDRANRDERDAARSVIASAQAGVTPPRSAVDVLTGYVRRQQEQDRWGR